MINSIPLDISADQQRTQMLHSGWQLADAGAGVIADPQQLQNHALCWRDAVVPGTVAQSLAADINAINHYDAQDWWYRCTFQTPAPQRATRLHLEGLATLADIWLNGVLILSTHNMFTAHRVELGDTLRADNENNELVICFRSLDAAMAARRPRPRWKTALVTQQALRWFRTTLLGRMPGWTPPTTVVGPWQAIALEQIAAIDIAALDLQTSASAGVGRIRVAAQLRTATPTSIDTAILHVGAQRFVLTVQKQTENTAVFGDFSLTDIALWWPHTHGTPHLFPCHIEVISADESVLIDCGRVGFKEITIDRSGGKVQLQINGAAIFCRGACWTIDDFNTLRSTPTQLRQTLQLARDAGANMLRIGGTMTYECDEFYALCDELGLLVWQDFMFANMDYPFGDTTFHGDIEYEVTQQLQRLQKHPCIAVYCGGSEIEQQAAMLGLPAAEWSNDFFARELPALCTRLHNNALYFPSTPCEGVLPFDVASGISHYYGVGAYRRPLTDAKHAQVKFASECLGFANVPDPQTMELLLDGVVPVPHHPRWKARVPRDNGAGWDFDDIRDHYLKLLFAVDPIALRSVDIERYYALSRVVSGEVMKAVFAEWRKTDNACSGALIWFYKDLWPGAGWGIVDSTNRPKAAYWYLRRAWAPLGVLISDEGLDGLQLHLHNETSTARAAIVSLELLQHGKTTIATAQQTVTMSAASTTPLHANALLGHFTDITYAYRFGPPKHDVVVTRLRCAITNKIISEDFYFPQSLNLPLQNAVQLEASADFIEDGVIVTLQSNCFLQNIYLAVNDFAASDNYFHLAPHIAKQIHFTAQTTAVKKFKAHVSALNWRESITLRAERS